MAVWTISAQDGTPGHRVAAELAAAAGVPFYDRTRLVELAGELQIEVPGIDQLEERVCGRHSVLLFMAAGAAPAETISELKLRDELPELGRRLLGLAAREPCVIEATVAFAALGDHPNAVHTRLRAPFDWRLAAYQREHLVDRHHAEKALRHADHLQHAWVRKLYRLDADDESRYALVLDTSRLSCDRLVETLLAAGGGIALSERSAADAA